MKQNNSTIRAFPFILIFSVLISGCGESDQSTASVQAGSDNQQQQVDLILTNGKVLTLDEEFSIHDTVVINDGLIVMTGDSTLLGDYQADELIDLEGKLLMPGFNDSHIHVSGNAKRQINLSGVSSIVEMQSLIRAKVEELGEGEWITGYGWAEDNFAENRNPLRSDLDLAAPNNPVVLSRAGNHSAVANSLALELANITRDTPQPEFGVIEMDAAGEPNGIIREEQQMVTRLVPPATYEELIGSLEINLNALLEKGITSITNAVSTPSDYRMWEELYGDAQLPLPRAAMQMIWTDPVPINALREQVGAGNDMLKLGAIKIAVDGGFTGPAAYTTEPYKDQGDYRGYLNMPEAELAAIIKTVHDTGWQMGIHAIGDAAIILVVDILADVLESNPQEDHRHYLNHLTMQPPDATMEKMAEYGIHVTQQPNFTYTLEQRYVDNLDGWRLEHNNPLRSPMDHGLTVAISSDVLPIGPMVGLYAAVTRKGKSGRVFAAEEAITMAEAIRGYTLLGAYLNFEEDVKGSLEPGKFADMVMLSEDLLTIDPESIMDVQVEKTWIGGELVYQREAATTASHEKAAAEIAEQTAAFASAFNAGDASSAVDAYFVRDNDQPAVYGPGAPPVVGREALVGLFTSLIERQPVVRVLRHDILLSDGLAFETGRVIFTDKEGVDAIGRFAVGWTETEYGWRAKIDFYSPDGWPEA